MSHEIEGGREGGRGEGITLPPTEILPILRVRLMCVPKLTISHDMCPLNMAASYYSSDATLTTPITVFQQ